MQFQQTIKQNVTFSGFDFYGGNLVDVTLRPAEEDTGIIFVTHYGTVKADINLARPSRSSILLKNSSNTKASVIHVEHILATLFAYGIDNVIIELNRTFSKSFKLLKKFGLATEIEVLPVSEDRELTLCNRIEEAGVQEQSLERRLLRLSKPVYTDRLSFEPIEEGLIINATTCYDVSGMEVLEFKITPSVYRDELSKSRMFAKHVPTWMPHWLASALASIAYPSFGIGHGFTYSTIFLPTKTKQEWGMQQIYDKEIVRHTIVDRLGAIALLNGRLEGVKVIAKFSGHANDINVLKNNLLPNLEYR